MIEVKGWGPWKYKWFSFCSAHGLGAKDDCPACNSGMWVNVWKYKVEHFIYKKLPKFWRWWMIER